MAWLDIKDLEAFYHRSRVLHRVSVEMERGDFVSVIGSNGAGKTTLLRSVSRLVTVKGSLKFDGQELAALGPKDCVRLGIVHCPEGRLLFPDMSVLQNLQMGAFLREDKAGIRLDLDRVYGYFPVLSHRKRQVAGTLSGGEQQMVAIGRAVMGRPRLLTLDEPSFGLAPIVVSTIVEVIERLNGEGVTLLLVEQNASLALEYGRYSYVLEEGRVVDQGPTSELSQKSSIIETYLGMA
ncbi:MAG: ABC transporter ATP-binding protein [Deltaproteobacteria bacterium]